MGFVVYFEFLVYCAEFFSSVVLLAAFLYFVYRYCYVSEGDHQRRSSGGIKVVRVEPTEETKPELSFPEKERSPVKEHFPIKEHSPFKELSPVKEHSPEKERSPEKKYSTSNPQEVLDGRDKEKSLSDAFLQISSSQANFVPDKPNDKNQTALSKASILSKDAPLDKPKKTSKDLETEKNLKDPSKASNVEKEQSTAQDISKTEEPVAPIEPEKDETKPGAYEITPINREKDEKTPIKPEDNPQIVPGTKPVNEIEEQNVPKAEDPQSVAPDSQKQQIDIPIVTRSEKVPVSESEKDPKSARGSVKSKGRDTSVYSVPEMEIGKKLSRSGPKSSDPMSIFYSPKERDPSPESKKFQEPPSTYSATETETPKSKLSMVSEKADRWMNEDANEEEETMKPTSILKHPEKERSEEQSYVEGVVCQAEDVPENGMKVCDLGEEGRVLLVKKNGRFSALGTKCSHYGAPLVNGALGDTRIRCPWHGACFNIETGDIEDFPGLDSIPCYNVQVTPEGGVKVRAKISELKSNRKEKPLAVVDPNNNITFVIIGGGAAGQVCAETLRQEGFSGKLIMITADKYHPYDRIKLSKQLDVTVEKILLRPQDFYKSNSIEVRTGIEVTGVNCTSKTIELSDGEQLSYNSLFVATGGIPRVLSLPGSDLKNIFTLRSLDDANLIQSELTPDKDVVIYGSSFIGMEAAAYCVGKVNSVTVVGRSGVPFSVSFGKVVGERVAKLFSDKGVTLKMLSLITSFEGDGKVQKVILSDDTELPADIVILGLGSAHATAFLKGSGIKMTESGSVPVNKFLETNISQVFAGGDIAEAPVFANRDTQQSIGHWGLAHYHGRIAAMNMMSKTTPLKTVPFFWTMIFGTSFRFAGTVQKHDGVIIKGDVDALKFAVYYMKNDVAIGVTTVGVDPIAAEFAECLHRNGSLRKSQIEANPLDWFKNI